MMWQGKLFLECHEKVHKTSAENDILGQWEKILRILKNKQVAKLLSIENTKNSDCIYTFIDT